MTARSIARLDRYARLALKALLVAGVLLACSLEWGRQSFTAVEDARSRIEVVGP
jgi:hypothetical protein